MDEQREQFEAWLLRRQGPTGDTPGYPGSVPFYHDQEAAAWEGWQAAAQRQQERIAYVEKVADDAIELGNQQAIRIAELQAQVQALSVDAGRQPPADWSVFNSGAEVASGLSWAEAMEYMTPARLDRGWSFVCVADKSNLDAAIAAGKGEG